jgi:hypothetical protein
MWPARQALRSHGKGDSGPEDSAARTPLCGTALESSRNARARPGFSIVVAMKTRALMTFLFLVAVGFGASSQRGVVAPGLAAAEPRILFDDFSYVRRAQLTAHGWIVRAGAGWPGVKGATWSADNVSFVADPARRGNRVLRMSSSTDGTAGGTSQTQVCHQRKYLEGTYATRVRFRDAPTRGPDADQLVETFYSISPPGAPLDPDYSELDWEYLPNGGWGVRPSVLFVTTWETFQLDPWIAVNTHTPAVSSLNGWHTLMMQVANGTVSYYLDGARLARHGGKYYPEVPMSINYNLWFISDGLGAAGERRRYDEDVDWVFHQAGAVLTPAQVRATVARLRRGRITFRDTVPAATPPLVSPCNF